MKLHKLIYKGLLTGLPSLTYNSYRENTFIAPFQVDCGSTYINYELDESRREKIEEYLREYNKEYDNKFELVPISILESEDPKYYLSINIYKCVSPMFRTEDKMTRCEINTYVKNKEGMIGTLIIDYSSDKLSLDPVNIFKFSKTCQLNVSGIPDNFIDIYTFTDKFTFESRFNKRPEKKLEVHKDLVFMTDIIYYKNGIYDRVHYNSHLAYPEISELSWEECVPYFRYLDTETWLPTHAFYFRNELSFTVSIWENVFDI